MVRNRNPKVHLLPLWLAGACSAGFIVTAPPALAQGEPEPAAAQRTADAAKAAALAAQAAAASAVPAPSADLLRAPPAPTPAPVLTFAAATPEPAQDLLGSADAMPVASAKLLATLTAEPAAPAMPVAPAAPLPTPAFAPAVMPATAAPEPLPSVPAVPLAPLGAPTLLASLGAAPVKLPSADALEAAVAVQATPVPPPAPVYVAPAAPAPRVQFASARAAPRSRRGAINAGNARFMRAVVSTAAVSVEMPDVGRQISPFGLLLGQLVASQETPGSQYGLAEEMAMPTRPRLMSMPEVAVPQGFCSAEQRGAFMEGIYQPAMAIARHNSDVAAAYVRKLRTLYDNYQLSGDTRAQGAIAAEAKDFARTANAASSIQDELAGQFEDIMTIPVSTCGASQ